MRSEWFIDRGDSRTKVTTVHKEDLIFRGVPLRP